ncbi:hypothetical protein LXA43DRAFT_1066756 [Ganoderma leucocontextum]|nr:hypothetical protein LXA43DRAFT_1066756 [Ganoderma leucocontextum]
MDSQTLTEAALLSILPPGSRIVSPSAITFIKHPDGKWWNWSNNNVCTGRTLQPSHTITSGSWAHYPNEGPPRYIKHGDGNWLRYDTQAPSNSFAQSTGAGHSADHHGAGSFAAPPQTIVQTIYHNGPVPVDDTVVPFNVPMSSAEKGQVADVAGYAFTGELAVQEKASIRFGFAFIESSEYKPKQHNLQRAGAPITRGHLAFLIAREVSVVMAALQRINRPLTSPSGRPVAFEELVLVDVRRVSRGTLQPTIAVRTSRHLRAADMDVRTPMLQTHATHDTF